MLKLFALPLAITLMSGIAAAQNQLGSATVTGPVLVDGQNATGTVAVANAARISTGDNASVTLRLAQGGEIMMAGQADVIVTSTPAGPHVQLICGEVSVTSTAPATIVSTNGARVYSKVGRSVVTEGAKTTTIKEEKTRDFDGTISVAVSGAGATSVVTSRIKCNCNCH
jgi:hypothetical protein